jgi:hypothetical protein
MLCITVCNILFSTRNQNLWLADSYREPSDSNFDLGPSLICRHHLYTDSSKHGLGGRRRCRSVGFFDDSGSPAMHLILTRLRYMRLIKFRLATLCTGTALTISPGNIRHSQPHDDGRHRPSWNFAATALLKSEDLHAQCHCRPWLLRCQAWNTTSNASQSMDITQDDAWEYPLEVRHLYKYAFRNFRYSVFNSKQVHWLLCISASDIDDSNFNT